MHARVYHSSQKSSLMFFSLPFVILQHIVLYASRFPFINLARKPTVRRLGRPPPKNNIQEDI